MHCKVTIEHHGKDAHCGDLYTQARNGRESVMFRYSDVWLETGALRFWNESGRPLNESRDAVPREVDLPKLLDAADAAREACRKMALVLSSWRQVARKASISESSIAAYTSCFDSAVQNLNAVAQRA